jgi:flagellar motor switch/type III secretory pathway protein FliN
MNNNDDDAPASAEWSPFSAAPEQPGEKQPSGDRHSNVETAQAMLQEMPAPKRKTFPRVNADAEAYRGAVEHVPLNIEAVIGRARLSVSELMQVKRGDLLRLDRKFGEPIELRVNGRIIGYGEIAADANDNLIGIRMLTLTATG